MPAHTPDSIGLTITKHGQSSYDRMLAVHGVCAGASQCQPGRPHAVHEIDHLPDLVLVYEEVIRSLGIARPVPVGYSFGGILAAELEATFLDLPDKLVLLDVLGLWWDDAPVARWILTPTDRLPELLFHSWTHQDKQQKSGDHPAQPVLRD
jgi:pimeloyl-ACP methyl ester carboxylesterase